LFGGIIATVFLKPPSPGKGRRMFLDITRKKCPYVFEREEFKHCIWEGLTAVYAG